ncbi:DUF1674 domain-containing protein [Hymenobacter jeollabukensis]|uniref:DUF1674 domain-containing protein n=1 Tax=Hymenobacter jeollabukensis TaxID=2025313 RepID=UPI0014851A9B|nr:DUF1674 domain-containing protein [Hymenobacter jeollabukensis]
MNQSHTSPPAEQTPQSAQRPAPTVPTAAASAAGVATRPAPRRVRYWEQLDPACHSLYPVD